MASFTDPRGCASISGELVDLARGRPDPALGLSASLDHCQTTLLVGDLETSDRYLHQAERQARAVGHPARMWPASAWRAMRLGLRGRFRDAESAAEAAFELGSRSGQPAAATWFASQPFTLRWHQGRIPARKPEELSLAKRRDHKG